MLRIAGFVQFELWPSSHAKTALLPFTKCQSAPRAIVIAVVRRLSGYCGRWLSWLRIVMTLLVLWLLWVHFDVHIEIVRTESDSEKNTFWSQHIDLHLADRTKVNKRTPSFDSLSMFGVGAETQMSFMWNGWLGLQRGNEDKQFDFQKIYFFLFLVQFSWGDTNSLLNYLKTK